MKMDGTKARTLPILPPDVIAEIFTWIPIKPLRRFRSVSKHICSLLTSDVHFAKKHYNRTNQNTDEQRNGSLILQATNSNEFFYIPNGAFDKAVKLDSSYIGRPDCIVGSSNGFICFFNTSGKMDSSPNGLEVLSFSLWNPVTKEYKTFPSSNFDKVNKIIPMGFGFHPVMNDYMVVKLLPVGNTHIKVDLFSLSTNSWKTVGETFPYTLEPSLSTLVVNGCAHWVASHGASNKHYKFILSFDMGNEVFRETPMPEPVQMYEIHNPFCILGIYLEAFRGRLFMFVMIHRIGIDIWEMKEHEGTTFWTKLFRVEDRPNTYWPLGGFLNDDELLLAKPNNKRLTSYNLLSRVMNDVPVPKLKRRSRLDAVPYSDILVQLLHNQSVDSGQQSITKRSRGPDGEHFGVGDVKRSRPSDLDGKQEVMYLD